METSDIEEIESDINFDAASEYSSQLRRMSCSNELHEIILPPPPPGQPDERTLQKVRSGIVIASSEKSVFLIGSFL